MPAVIDAMLGALRHDTLRVERIGVNLANALTPGYAREVLVPASPSASAAAFSGMLEAQGVRSADDAPRVLRDTRPGTLKPTREPWDLALASSGYFEVATPAGPAYTRRGDFHVDAEGRLVTAHGWPVLGVGGELRPGTEPAVVDPTGQVRVGSRVVGQIKVVALPDAARLGSLEGGYLVADTGAAMPATVTAVVRQGFLENANVAAGVELVELMRTLRHFESTTRALQGYDDMLGGAIRRLGER